MAVPQQYITPAITNPSPRVPAVDPNTGQLSTTGMQMLQQMWTSVNGLSPTVSCNAAFSLNLYTLTPVEIAPRVKNYYSYWSFAFVAPATSTGAVTATVVPATGSLASLPVYTNNGAAQANAGDITINLFYLLYFVDSLNAGNGGFVLK